MFKNLSNKNIRNKVTAVGTILPTPILQYNDEHPDLGNFSGQQAETGGSVTEFFLSVKHSVNGTENESIIKCRTTNTLAGWSHEYLKPNIRVRISGELATSYSALVYVHECEILEQNTQPDYLHAIFTGSLVDAPHLHLSDSEHPYANYILQVETDEDYIFNQIPCTVMDTLCTSMSSDFHHGAFITVEGELYTKMHEEVATLAYDVCYTDISLEEMMVSFDENKKPILRPRVPVYRPKLFVTAQNLTPEEQTRANQEQAYFQEFLRKNGFLNQE